MDTAAWQDVARLMKGPHQMRVCLIGPTGVGKTARVRDFAATLNLPVKVLLLAGRQPEDIQGIPIPDRDSKRTWDTLPDWFDPSAPCVLFLDELDKASSELHNTILTLLWDQSLRGETLHPDTIIITAMQEVDTSEFLATTTGRGIAARLAFYPLSQDWNWLAAKHHAECVRNLPVEAVPTRPIAEQPSPRAVDYALSCYMQGLDVFNAVLPPHTAEFLRAGMLPVAPQQLIYTMYGEREFKDIPDEVASLLTPSLALDIFRATIDTCKASVFLELYKKALKGEEVDIQAPFRRLLAEHWTGKHHIGAVKDEQELCQLLIDGMHEILSAEYEAQEAAKK